MGCCISLLGIYLLCEYSLLRDIKAFCQSSVLFFIKNYQPELLTYKPT